MKKNSYLPLIVLLLVIAGGLVMYSAFARNGGPFFAPLKALFNPPSSTSTPSGGVVTTSTPGNPAPSPTQGTGVVRGHLDIGPLCPVERNPPDPACQPGPAQYNQYKIVVYDAAHKTLLNSVALDAQGNYRIALQPGTYVIDISPHPDGRIGGASGVPRQVQVKSGETVTVDISIDTGIR